MLAQDFRDAKLDRHMNIVAAGMFDSRVLRFVRHINIFLNRQRIHIRAHGDDGAGLCASKQRSHSVSAYVCLHVFKSERAQSFGNDARRALFAVRQLRVHVKIAALLDQLWRAKLRLTARFAVRATRQTKP